jgi:hopene-associated glycosyltransferase HpnB
VSWLAAVPLTIWVYLLVLRASFWRTGVRLPLAADLSSWPAVVVLVPARNEADVLPMSLGSLLTQDYAGSLRVVLVDDQSTDHTAELTRTLAAEAGRGVELEVLAGEEPPPGWAGKLWALSQGVSAVSSETGPEFLLFTDADISHPPSSVRQLVAWAETGRLDQVSLMARLKVDNGWERLLIPAFVYFFAELYPFARVNRADRKTAAAAGGCMLVRRQALEKAGGVSAIRGAVIDDVALARALKASGSTIWLGLADEVRSVRPYPALSDIWDMVARSAYTQLVFSPLLLFATLLGLAVTFVGPIAVSVVGLLSGSVLVFAVGAASWLIMTITYLPVIRYHGLGSWRALGLPLAALFYGAMTTTSAWRHYRKGVAWKGRHYGAVTG